MPRLPTIPASISPPLRCERLEDRSLLSATMLSSVTGASVVIEPTPGQLLPPEGVVREERVSMVSLDPSSVRTADWQEGRDGYITMEVYWADTSYYEQDLDDSWYFEDESYYEQDWSYEEEYWVESWYYEHELYYDESWYYEDETYYEEEYWDESWYYEDETYCEEAWDGEYAFVDGDGMTWEEYEAVWLNWDRGADLPALVPDKYAGDWSFTLSGWTDLDEGIVYATALAGGIPISDAPSDSEIATDREILPLPVSTPGEDAAAAIAPALPPGTSVLDAVVSGDTVVPPVEENSELPAPMPAQAVETAEGALPALAASTVSEDHLTEVESLELSEDLPIG